MINRAELGDGYGAESWHAVLKCLSRATPLKIIKSHLVRAVIVFELKIICQCLFLSTSYVELNHGFERLGTRIPEPWRSIAVLYKDRSLSFTAYSSRKSVNKIVPCRNALINAI